MATIRPSLKPISGNNQKIRKETFSRQAVHEQVKSTSHTIASDTLLDDIDHPFIIPIELYLSVREPTTSLHSLDLKSYPSTIKTMLYTTTFFEPARAEILALIQSSLGDSTVLNTRFDWAYVEGTEGMPTVSIDVPQGTVTDWADLESRIRGLLARAASKLGIVVDVQFQVKSAANMDALTNGYQTVNMGMD